MCNSCQTPLCTHANHLGSASWITDKAGQPIQYIHYAPYGELLANQCPYGYDERFKFTGKERDEESGCDFFGARYYDHRKGFWNSVDPLVDKYPNVTPYLYCEGNPVMLVDPDGRLTVKSEDGITLHVDDTSDDHGVYLWNQKGNFDSGKLSEYYMPIVGFEIPGNENKVGEKCFYMGVSINPYTNDMSFLPMSGNNVAYPNDFRDKYPLMTLGADILTAYLPKINPELWRVGFARNVAGTIGYSGKGVSSISPYIAFVPFVGTIWTIGSDCKNVYKRHIKEPLNKVWDTVTQYMGENIWLPCESKIESIMNSAIYQSYLP